MSVETVEKTVDAVEIGNEKPYKFRLLGAPDMFLMARILSKIGIKQFKECLSGESVQSLLGSFAAGGEDDSALAAVGVGVALEAAGIILENLPKCEAEIYQLLAQTSNMEVEEITAPGNAVMFFEMLVDFIRKEEFRDFIKAASRLLK